jgi:DNA-binding transcriptional MerR regulator
VTSAAQFYSASDAASRLGVSVKALRLYEERGLVTPTRSAAGWRTFGPEAMARGAEVVALRTIGLSLSRVAQVLSGDAKGFGAALAAHQNSLREQIDHLSRAVDRVSALQADLAQGKPPNFLDLTNALASNACQVSFDLPWPWGGERFELHHVRALNYIVGPLGSRGRRCRSPAENWHQ